MVKTSLVPEIYCSDIELTKSFYLEILGFTIKYQRVDDQFICFSCNHSKIIPRLQQLASFWAVWGKLYVMSAVCIGKQSKLVQFYATINNENIAWYSITKKPARGQNMSVAQLSSR